MKVRYSRRALSQLASVYDYLQQRNQGAAENVVTSIRATIGRLRDMPFLGRMTDEADVHVIVEPDYLHRVFYRVQGQEVFVIRILHGRLG
jgi:toxin ParE1/3/4